MADMAFYLDTSKCTGCKGCQVACKVWNNLPTPLGLNECGEFSGSLQNPVDLGPYTRRIVTYRERKGDRKHGVDWAFGTRACMHCTDAACVEVCPSGCLYHDEETGLVTYDPEKCVGCQYCRSACPFDVPRHENVDVWGGKITINKCTGCVDRVKHGMKPACVSTCQPGAFDFGDRDEMLAKAHARVDYLKEKGFTDASVYGETEMGGLHTIEVLKYDHSMYEVVDNPSKNNLDNVMNVLKPILGFGSIALFGGLGLCYLLGVGYHRDNLVYDEEKHDVVDLDTGEIVKHIDKEAGER